MEHKDILVELLDGVLGEEAYSRILVATAEDYPHAELEEQYREVRRYFEQTLDDISFERWLAAVLCLENRIYRVMHCAYELGYGFAAAVVRNATEPLERKIIPIDFCI